MAATVLTSFIVLNITKLKVIYLLNHLFNKYLLLERNELALCLLASFVKGPPLHI